MRDGAGRNRHVGAGVGSGGGSPELCPVRFLSVGYRPDGGRVSGARVTGRSAVGTQWPVRQSRASAQWQCGAHSARVGHWPLRSAVCAHGQYSCMSIATGAAGSDRGVPAGRPGSAIREKMQLQIRDASGVGVGCGAPTTLRRSGGRPAGAAAACVASTAASSQMDSCSRPCGPCGSGCTNRESPCRGVRVAAAHCAACEGAPNLRHHKVRTPRSRPVHIRALRHLARPICTIRLTSPLCLGLRKGCVLRFVWSTVLSRFGRTVLRWRSSLDQCAAGLGIWEAAPAESVASAALRAGLRALRLHPSQCCGRRAQAAAQCIAALDTCGSVERSRPEGRARATERRWHRRVTHWVEHGVRAAAVCMSCARGQLWRDEAACGRHQLVCRAGGAEQTLHAKDAGQLTRGRSRGWRSPPCTPIQRFGAR
eukprot:5088050-Prymnesium_polylepis.1